MAIRTSVLKYGSLTTESGERAKSNFAGAIVNPLSMCCSPVEILSLDGLDRVVAHASGFFYLYRERAFFVTSWHVLSGRNPLDGSFLTRQRFIPTRFRLHVPSVTLRDVDVSFSRTIATVQLRSEEFYAEPPTNSGVPFDIAALDLEDHGPSFQDERTKPEDSRHTMDSLFLNENSQEILQSRVSDECSIIGYPIRNYEGLILPIWKSGRIASETNVGIGDIPAFLVDSATTMAMSGSPVIRIEKFPGMTPAGQPLLFERLKLVGVYGGRLRTAALEKTQLGYAYYATMIDQVLESKFINVTV